MVEHVKGRASWLRSFKQPSVVVIHKNKHFRSMIACSVLQSFHEDTKCKERAKINTKKKQKAKVAEKKKRRQTAGRKRQAPAKQRRTAAKKRTTAAKKPTKSKGKRTNKKIEHKKKPRASNARKTPKKVLPAEALMKGASRKASNSDEVKFQFNTQSMGTDDLIICPSKSKIKGRRRVAKPRKLKLSGVKKTTKRPLKKCKYTPKVAGNVTNYEANIAFVDIWNGTNYETKLLNCQIQEKTVEIPEMCDTGIAVRKGPSQRARKNQIQKQIKQFFEELNN